MSKLGHAGNVQFHANACAGLERHVTSRLVGQELAVRQATDAICDHLQNENPLRPLVLSVHGPPGVGKSLFHYLAAQALYAPDPNKPHLKCPGYDCAGYKVRFEWMRKIWGLEWGLLRGALERCWGCLWP